MILPACHPTLHPTLLLPPPSQQRPSKTVGAEPVKACKMADSPLLPQNGYQSVDSDWGNTLARCSIARVLTGQENAAGWGWVGVRATVASLHPTARCGRCAITTLDETKGRRTRRGHSEERRAFPRGLMRRPSPRAHTIDDGPGVSPVANPT